MNEYLIKVATQSPVLLGSGEGWGSVVDADIVFDAVGLPSFPARRLKGLLKESAQEVLEMFATPGLTYFQSGDLENAFGKAGSVDGGSLTFSTLQFPDYGQVYAWCRWALTRYSGFISQDVIVNAQTEIREHTAIGKDEVAQDHSLRRFRAIRANTIFEGRVGLIRNDPAALPLLGLACLNLRHVGTSRHKGYGEIVCALYEGETDLSQKIINDLREGVFRCMR
jgi:CRISPR/Cas system CSM-associated protein Csm3 (group 7 of RAMP superfamily)